MAEEAIRTLKDEGDTKRFFVNGFIKTVEARDLPREWCSMIVNCGKWKLLRLSLIEGKWHALFRLTGNDCFDYYDFFLVAKEDGEVAVEDYYTYTLCETFGDGIRRYFLLSRSLGLPVANESLDAGKKMQQHLEAGEFREAMAALENMPEPFKREKWVLQKKASIASHISPETYVEVVEEMRRQFPDCVGLEIDAVGRFAAEKQFDKAMDSVDRVDRLVGGDTYLDVMRGYLLVLEGKYQQARPYLTKSLLQEDDLPDTYRVLAGLAMQEGDFQEAVRCFTVIETKLKRKLPDFVDFPRYPAFARSSEYKAWRASHTR